VFEKIKAMKLSKVPDFTPMFKQMDFINPDLFFYQKYKKIGNKKVYQNITHAELLIKLKAFYPLAEIIEENIFVNTKLFQEELKGIHTQNDREEKLRMEYCDYKLAEVVFEPAPEILIYFNLSFKGYKRIELIYSPSADLKTVLNIERIILTCCKIIAKKENVHLVTQSMGELSLRETKIDSIFTELSENYNDDLLEINDIILKRLNKENDKGLVLLHGIPGTGKTSYIRHLIQNIEKNLIYMPTDLAREIANPSFIDFMLENKNSVLIIEDAEDILESRNSGRNGVLANLLNVTDGLLSDCLKIQIVCTFNTNLKNIDSALLRKGRLIARYEFKKLSVQKSQALSAKLGFDKTINHEMTLSEIFNQEEIMFEESKKTIGF
jgi:hypothetical protein